MKRKKKETKKKETTIKKKYKKMLIDGAILTGCLVSLSLFLNGVSFNVFSKEKAKTEKEKRHERENRTIHQLTMVELLYLLAHIDAEEHDNETWQERGARRNRIEDEIERRHREDNVEPT